MNVITTINGHLTAEVSALYGLHFARVNDLSLILLHIINPNDSIKAVEESMANMHLNLVFTSDNVDTDQTPAAEGREKFGTITLEWRP